MYKVKKIFFDGNRYYFSKLNSISEGREKPSSIQEYSQILLDKVIKYINLLARKVQTVQKDLAALQEIQSQIYNKSEFNVENFLNLVQLLNNTLEFKKYVQGRHPLSKPLESSWQKDIKDFKKVFYMLSRATVDWIKFVELILPRIDSSSISVELLPNLGTIHAEMVILENRVKRGVELKAYIGISKLCCKLCYTVMKIIGLKDQVRGSHEVMYTNGWGIPKLSKGLLSKLHAQLEEEQGLGSEALEDELEGVTYAVELVKLEKKLYQELLKELEQHLLQNMEKASHWLREREDCSAISTFELDIMELSDDDCESEEANQNIKNIKAVFEGTHSSNKATSAQNQALDLSSIPFPLGTAASVITSGAAASSGLSSMSSSTAALAAMMPSPSMNSPSQSTIAASNSELKLPYSPDIAKAADAAGENYFVSDMNKTLAASRNIDIEDGY